MTKTSSKLVVRYIDRAGCGSSAATCGADPTTFAASHGSPAKPSPAPTSTVLGPRHFQSHFSTLSLFLSNIATSSHILHHNPAF